MIDQPLFALDGDDDALRPGLIDPTPVEQIMRLDRKQREERVTNLVRQAHDIYRMGVDLAEDREIVASCLLFSGGNDSTVLGHVMRPVATHAIHANTGIGIEETRQFVRDTCQAWGLPLIEEHPPVSYRELVLDQGFPGPAMHFKMYQRLKERCLRQARKRLVEDSRKQRVLFIAGRRRAESARRADIPLHETDGSVIWVSPLAMWTKLDMQTYRLMQRNVPVNKTSELVGMSGECLCGAFAKPNELEMIREHYPDTAADIDALQAEVHAAGIPEPYCHWGHGQGKPSYQTGPMCTSCTMTDPLWDLMTGEAA